MTRAELRRRRREVERTLRTLRGEMDLQLGELLQELAALDAAERELDSTEDAHA